MLGNLTLACVGPYDIPNVWVDARTVYTNNIAGGAFRGFGGPQGHWIAEMQMNRLAEALDMDPVEVRMRNVLHDGSIIATGSEMPAGVTVDRVLEQAALAAGWQQTGSGWTRPESGDQPSDLPPTHRVRSLDASPGRKARGIGIAASFKNVGFSLGVPEECYATIELHGGARSSGRCCAMPGPKWDRARIRRSVRSQPPVWTYRWSRSS